MACIIRSGPQMNATALRPSHVARSNSWVTIPTRPSQSGPARSTVSPTSMSPAGGERADLRHVQPVGRRPGAEVEPDGTERVAPREAGVDQRAQRRQADAAGDDDDVAAGQLARPASHDRADRAGRGSRRARAGSGLASRDRRPGWSGRGRPAGSATAEMGAAENAGSAAMTNWPGLPASSRRSEVWRWSVTVSAVSRVVLVDVDRHEAPERRGRRWGGRRRSTAGAAGTTAGAGR